MYLYKILHICRCSNKFSYIYTNALTHAHTHTHTHAHTRTHTHTNTHTRLHAHLHAHTHTHTCTRACIYKYTHQCVKTTSFPSLSRYSFPFPSSSFPPNSPSHSLTHSYIRILHMRRQHTHACRHKHTHHDCVHTHPHLHTTHAQLSAETAVHTIHMFACAPSCTCLSS